MKIIYASDVHGGLEAYFGIFKLMKQTKSDLLVFGGDMLTGAFADTPREKVALRQKKCADILLSSFDMLDREVVFILGNDDLRINEKYMIGKLKDLPKVHYLNKDHFVKDDFAFVGYPFVTPSPFTDKDWEKLDTKDAVFPDRAMKFDDKNAYSSVKPEKGYIYDDLSAMMKKVPKDKKVILITHDPPHGTNLDAITELDPDAHSKLLHTGSMGVRKIIEEYQPYASFHGHIHESNVLTRSYHDTIGKTISFNPGWASKWMVNVMTFDTESMEHRLLGFVDEHGISHDA
jgi:Icc-related predicted phosphoesterase